MMMMIKNRFLVLMLLSTALINYTADCMSTRRHCHAFLEAKDSAKILKQPDISNGQEPSLDTLITLADQAFKGKQEFCQPSVGMRSKNAIPQPLFSAAALTKIFTSYLEKMCLSRKKSPGGKSSFVRKSNWHTQPSSIHPNKLANDYPIDKTKDQANLLPFVQKENIADNERVIFLGDLHGSLHSLLRNLLHLAEEKLIDNNFKLAPQVKLVMLGDMTDRGCYGAEVVCLLLALKLQNWDNIFLLRGNHEGAAITDRYGFKHELACKYTLNGTTLYDLFIKCCRTLPLALFLQNNGVAVQCCHGGIEPYYSPNEFLTANKKYDVVTANVSGLNPAIENNTLHQVGDGFQWSDFNGFHATWIHQSNDTWSLQATKHWSFLEADNKWLINSSRGIGFNANPLDVNKYFADRSTSGAIPIVKIIRGHQDRESCCKLIEAGADYPVEWCQIPPYIQQYGRQPALLGDTKSSEICRQNRIKAAREGLNFSAMPDVVTWTSAVEGQGTTSEGYGTLIFTPGGYTKWLCKIYQNPTVDENIAPGNPYGYVLARSINNYMLYDKVATHKWVNEQAYAGVSQELKDAILGTTNDAASSNLESLEKSEFAK